MFLVATNHLAKNLCHLLCNIHPWRWYTVWSGSVKKKKSIKKSLLNSARHNYLLSSMWAPSPWYNRNGWLGVKHQIAYALWALTKKKEKVHVSWEDSGHEFPFGFLLFCQGRRGVGGAGTGGGGEHCSITHLTHWEKVNRKWIERPTLRRRADHPHVLFALQPKRPTNETCDGESRSVF